jgi:hypothetical protein
MVSLSNPEALAVLDVELEDVTPETTLEAVAAGPMVAMVAP